MANLSSIVIQCGMFRDDPPKSLRVTIWEDVEVDIPLVYSEDIGGCNLYSDTFKGCDEDLVALSLAMLPLWIHGETTLTITHDDFTPSVWVWDARQRLFVQAVKPRVIDEGDVLGDD